MEICQQRSIRMEFGLIKAIFNKKQTIVYFAVVPVFLGKAPQTSMKFCMLIQKTWEGCTIEPDFWISIREEWHSDKTKEIKRWKTGIFNFFLWLQDDMVNNKKLPCTIKKAHFYGSYSRWFRWKMLKIECIVSISMRAYEILRLKNFTRP